jgi:hypothetical protein
MDLDLPSPKLTHKNSLTLYASGIGMYEREYTLPANPLNVSIPLNKDALSTALQTISWDGGQMVSPPSFSTSSEPALKIEGNVLSYFAKKLRGATISIQKSGSSITGQLIGDEVTEQDRGPFKSQTIFLCVLNNNGRIERIKVDDIVSYMFTEEHVRDEIERALRWSLDQTKPGSTSLHFTLKGELGTKARVRFGVPLASPKPTYRLRQVKDKCYLDICAVVFNPTGEQWDDTQITVVTGQPNALDTDIATPSMPVREKVFITPLHQGKAVQPKQAKVAVSRGIGQALQGNISAGFVSVSDETTQHFDTTQVEVGDYAKFTCNEPQTIAPHSAALVVLYSTTLNAELVLYYTWAVLKERAWRTIRAINTSPFPLGRGNYAVYQTDSNNNLTLMGEDVLDGVRRNDIMLVPHAIETGVLFQREVKDVNTKFSRVNISDGVMQQETIRETIVNYTISNLKDEDFTVIIDHECTIDSATVKSDDAEIVETIPNGVRFSKTVKKNSKTVIKVKETKLLNTRVEIGNFSLIKKTIIDGQLSFSNDPKIQGLVKLQEAIDKTDRDIIEQTQKVQALDQRMLSLRENLKVGSHGEFMDEWKTSLGESDRAANKIQVEIIPALTRKKTEQLEEMRKALKALKI